jgi:hypothetical protein
MTSRPRTRADKSYRGDLPGGQPQGKPQTGPRGHHQNWPPGSASSSILSARTSNPASAPTRASSTWRTTAGGPGRRHCPCPATDPGPDRRHLAQRPPRPARQAIPARVRPLTPRNRSFGCLYPVLGGSVSSCRSTPAPRARPTACIPPVKGTLRPCPHRPTSMPGVSLHPQVGPCRRRRVPVRGARSWSRPPGCASCGRPSHAAAPPSPGARSRRGSRPIPTVHGPAQDLGLAVVTVMRAYQELEEPLVRSRPVVAAGPSSRTAATMRPDPRGRATLCRSGPRDGAAGEQGAAHGRDGLVVLTRGSGGGGVPGERLGPADQVPHPAEAAGQPAESPGLHQHVAQRGGLHRPGLDRQAGGIGGEPA